MTKDDSTPRGHDGHLGHTVSHTDTATGKGGGQLTQDAGDTSPANRQTGVAGENGKNRDFVQGSDQLNGQDPEDVAGRMGSTGRQSGIA